MIVRTLNLKKKYNGIVYWPVLASSHIDLCLIKVNKLNYICFKLKANYNIKNYITCIKYICVTAMLEKSRFVGI